MKYLTNKLSQFKQWILSIVRRNFLSKQELCEHKEWDCDTQIRTIQCRKCGKRAWIKDYKSLYS